MMPRVTIRTAITSNAITTLASDESRRWRAICFSWNLKLLSETFDMTGGFPATGSLMPAPRMIPGMKGLSV